MDVAAQGQRNRVLRALPDEVYRAALAELRPVQLSARQTLFEHDQPIEQVYFPLNAVASLVVGMADGTAVECATTGNDGMVGLPVFLGARSLPMTCFTQVAGQALSMSTSAFRRLLADADGPFAVVLQRYTQTLFHQLAQNVACNRLHSVGQRCARWLLMTADRVDTPHLQLTHEFLALMLGVRRASVSQVAARFAAAGAIRYHHGIIEILDRTQLEHASCECYQSITSMLDRMLGDPAAAADTDNTGTLPRLR